MQEKFWLRHYPPQVPADINPDAYTSLVDLFDQTTARFSHTKAVSNFGTDLTYTALADLSKHFAAWLQQAAGLKKGDRFAIMLPNILQYYVAMMGALRAGLVVVNVNPLYTSDELQHQLSDAQVDTILVMTNFAHTVETALPNTPIKKVIITEIGDLFSFPKSFVFNIAARYLKKGIVPFHIPQAIAFKTALAQGKKLSLQPISLDHHDTAFLQYTGGTTGVPKGAVLSHGNIVANVEQATAWIKSAGLIEGKEIILAPLPLYHIFSLNVCGFCFLKLGGKAVLITNPRDMPHFLKVLKRTPYTVFVGINTLFNGLLQQTDFSALSFKALKLVVAGGMPLQKTVAEKWLAVTGIPILEGYGLTEASPIVTINPPGSAVGWAKDPAVFAGDVPTLPVLKSNSIGLPVPSTNVAIRDDNNQDVAIGQVGELCVSGPQVMREYWHNIAETKQVFTPDGWLKTGDIARFDEDGFLYIVDRKKDMILVSGFKVYPNEIEAVIAQQPGVKEVAVVGVPSDTSGEAVKAFVVRSDPALTAKDVIIFCRQHLTGYKTPHLVEFRDELPKSAVGKILRRELQK